MSDLKKNQQYFTGTSKKDCKWPASLKEVGGKCPIYKEIKNDNFLSDIFPQGSIKYLNFSPSKIAEGLSCIKSASFLSKQNW